ncbi:hypothetical protein [Ligilactobacillus salivarius]|uniref:Uncharacterized protein n=1 Tax=Ligilactobacillus salivarius TaxID=1624 RepID=A0A1V9RC57_9LACO|nr:hypothetical protein [Ligilactobacillus salivarius]MDW3022914.1 hypothetical protein [Ligilactobacillus salivarius]OQQ90531.1 hypothetical protein B6U56_04395 [Ligilactobacillus salivarius]QIG36519.1 hypothetical protein IBB3154_1030 [Ligilactobacillus salivarius]
MDFALILTNAASIATIVSLVYDILKNFFFSKKESIYIDNSTNISNNITFNNTIKLIDNDDNSTYDTIIFFISLLLSATIFKFITFLAFGAWILLFITAFIMIFSKKILFNSIKDKSKAYITLIVYILFLVFILRSSSNPNFVFKSTDLRSFSGVLSVFKENLFIIKDYLFSFNNNIQQKVICISSLLIVGIALNVIVTCFKIILYLKKNNTLPKVNLYTYISFLLINYLSFYYSYQVSNLIKAILDFIHSYLNS